MPNWKDDPVAQEELAYAFPDVQCGIEPVGDEILFQFRRPRKKTTGGIYMPDDFKDEEGIRTPVARVVEFGDLAFKDPATLETWKEGNWCEVGSFVLLPVYGGHYIYVKAPDGEKVRFALYRAKDVRGRIKPHFNPLDVAAYV